MRTRFAPSPTGPLHLGHAYSALLAHDMAQAAQGEFLLRIDDLDTTRSRVEFETGIYADLHWLGLSWPTPVRRQSEHLEGYENALEQLIELGVCYPCSCSRRDIRAAVSAPQEGAPGAGKAHEIYPGTCRHRVMSARLPTDAIRLDMARALDRLTDTGGLTFSETGAKHQGVRSLERQFMQAEVGDIVLARRDSVSASYHLSVVVDDAAQSITHVIRGEDLFEATFVHVLLQALLGLTTPVYHHHRLIRDEAGKRLAKRDDARAISRFRDDGLSAADVRAMVGL